ncbi:DUF1294 domain-containing protein [Rhizobium sp. Leaf311]|uniref:DUF1294 domain-containing protein n=1 Tax=Rhizobium sp. Leaf311 TaxID=1736332 RepID=UPI000B0101DE|nr:DUF1294 domain-containing protein [Rhizobium sp. Leaf311]
MAYFSAIAFFLAFNVVVFAIYWLDKSAAKNGGRRIRESTLLWLAAIGGSAGAVLAQRLLRHKTQKEPFRTILLAIVIVQMAAILSFVLVPEWWKDLLTSFGLGL